MLPESLARHVAENLSLPDIHTIQFRACRRIPFSWLVGGQRLAGLTLWNRVYVVADSAPREPLTRSTVELAIHELVHVIQYRRNPIRFPLRYVLDHLRYGYENNPAEIEARRTAGRIAESFFRGRGL